MPRTNRLSRRAVQAPSSREEANSHVRRIGKLYRYIQKTRLNLNERIEELKKQAETTMTPLVEEQETLFAGLASYAATTREELTEGGKRKTIFLPAGEIGWRIDPPSVSVRNVEAILERLKERGLKKFIRVKEEVDKEAMLKDPDKAASVEGVTIVRDREHFFAKPSEVDVDITGRRGARDQPPERLSPRNTTPLSHRPEEVFCNFSWGPTKRKNGRRQNDERPVDSRYSV